MKLMLLTSLLFFGNLLQAQFLTNSKRFQVNFQFGTHFINSKITSSYGTDLLYGDGYVVVNNKVKDRLFNQHPREIIWQNDWSQLFSLISKIQVQYSLPDSLKQQKLFSELTLGENISTWTTTFFEKGNNYSSWGGLTGRSISLGYTVYPTKINPTAKNRSIYIQAGVKGIMAVENISSEYELKSIFVTSRYYDGNPNDTITVTRYSKLDNRFGLQVFAGAGISIPLSKKDLHRNFNIELRRVFGFRSLYSNAVRIETLNTTKSYFTYSKGDGWQFSVGMDLFRR